MVCGALRDLDYGRAQHHLEKTDGAILLRPQARGLPALRLRSTVALTTHSGDISAEFRLRASARHRARYVLEEAREGEESPSASPDYVADTFKETMNFWLGWVGRSHYRGRWREMVNRSALTLKLLTFRAVRFHCWPAPTFGLPENVGGPRNWDYRYTWVLDASIYPVCGSCGWVIATKPARSCAGLEERCNELQPVPADMQTMYRIDGTGNLPEKASAPL